jgi:hypothetical protein
MISSFNIKYLMATAFVLAAIVVTTGCSSSPMKSRLEKNLVYQCSLELLGKNVSAGEAERICASAHKAEMDERAFSADLRAGRRVPVSRSPASNRVTPSADQRHPDESTED